MKLIYILNQYSEKESSHFYHIINLLEHLALKGVSIKLIIEKPYSVPKFNNKIDVIPQKRKNKIFRLIELFFILIRLYKSEGYNRVFIRISSYAGLVATFVAKLYKIKVYFWLSGATLEFDTNQPFGIKKIRWLFKTWFPIKIVSKYNTLVTGPESMREYYKKWLNIDPRKIIVLYNDIDTNRFSQLSENQKTDLKTKLGFDANTKIILYVKTLSPIRGIMFYFPYILDAAIKKLNNMFVFVVIGGGKEAINLKTSINNYKLTKFVKVLGSIPNKDIHYYYKAADLFINPTLAEGFPRVLLEAMACGLPIVTTDTGGIKDIIGDKQKEFMVEKTNRDDFVSKLIQLYNNKEKQKILSEENITVSRNYSTPKIAQMYIEKLFHNT